MPSKKSNPHPCSPLFRRAPATAVIPLMTANTPNRSTRTVSDIPGQTSVSMPNRTAAKPRTKNIVRKLPISCCMLILFLVE